MPRYGAQAAILSTYDRWMTDSSWLRQLVAEELDRPEHSSRSGWWPAQPRHGAELVGGTITAFTLDETTIEIEASNGSKLRCSADPDYEMWQLVIAGEGVWVGLPGGGVAVFEYPAGPPGDPSLRTG